MDTKEQIFTEKLFKTIPIPVIVLCALIIWYLGAAFFQRPQDSTVTGQIISGLAEYADKDNPFNIYHFSLWSTINQFSGLFLKFIPNEKMLSAVVSGSLFLFSFAGFFLLFSSCCSFLTAFLLSVFMITAKAYQGGIVYPVILYGTPYTYGMLSHTFTLFIIGCLVHKLYKPALFLSFLFPSMHPPTGMLLSVFLIIFFVINNKLWVLKNIKSFFNTYGKYIISGCLITLASFFLHMRTKPPVPLLPTKLSSEIVESFVTHWDVHRRTPDFSVLKTYQIFHYLLTGILAAFSVIFFRSKQKNDSLKEVSIAGYFLVYLLPLSCAVLLSWSGISLPIRGTLFNLSMPGRYLNFYFLFFIPLLFCIAHRTKHFNPLSILVFYLTAIIMLYEKQLLQYFNSRIVLRFLTLAVILFSAYPIIHNFFRKRQTGQFSKITVICVCIITVLIHFYFIQSRLLIAGLFIYIVYTLFSKYLTKLITAAEIFLKAALICILIYNAVPYFISNINMLSPKAIFKNYDGITSGVFKNMKGTAVYDTEMKSTYQYYNRIPPAVAIIAANFIPYFPNAAPVLDQQVNDIYGFSYKYPMRSNIDSEIAELWRRRTSEEWVALGKKHSFKWVVSSRAINLPIFTNYGGVFYYTATDIFTNSLKGTF